jgi:hypothetical protein
MTTAFNTLVEEIQECSLEQKEELRSLLDHYLIEERRNALLADHEASLAERHSGTLKTYDNMEDLLSDLKSE